MNDKTNNRNKLIKTIAIVSLTSVFITICSWIAIPFTISFTLQTFAIFFALRLFGGVKGLLSIILYVLLGLIGVPVFTGFKAGLGAILGPTGGYILGFILVGLLYLIIEKVTKLMEKPVFSCLILFVGLLICYLFGTLWFTFVMNDSGNNYTFLEALLVCVVPFIIPDIIKLVLAELIAFRIKKILFKDE